MTTIDLPDDSAALLAVVQTVLSGEVPDAALIGGLAVTARVASTTGYRATNDVDFVTADDAPPTFLEVITARHQVEAPMVIDGIKVDVIPTYDVTEADLTDIDDGPRLFVASHRWALDTAEAVTLRCTTPTVVTTVEVRLATPAALVAAKSHAVGFARSQRRATKHASDLLDVYRLVDRYHPPGRRAPGPAPARGGPGRRGHRPVLLPPYVRRGAPIGQRSASRRPPHLACLGWRRPRGHRSDRRPPPGGSPRRSCRHHRVRARPHRQGDEPGG